MARCRLFMHMALWLLCLGAPAVTVAQGIDGRRHPELLPEDVAWESLFDSVYALTGGNTDPTSRAVTEFVGGNVFLSTDDTAIFTDSVARAHERIAAIEGQMEQPDIPDAQLVELRHQLSVAVLEERDLLLGRLSARGRTGVLRFLAVVKHGLSVS